MEISSVTLRLASSFAQLRKRSDGGILGLGGDTGGLISKGGNFADVGELFGLGGELDGVGGGLMGFCDGRGVEDEW